MSNENITAPNTSDYKFNPQLSYFGTKIRIEFSGSCLKQYKITHDRCFEISKKVNISDYPKLESCLFGLVALTKNGEIDKYEYFGYCIGFDRQTFLASSSGTSKNVIILGADMSLSTNIGNKKKDK